MAINLLLMKLKLIISVVSDQFQFSHIHIVIGHRVNVVVVGVFFYKLEIKLMMCENWNLL